MATCLRELIKKWRDDADSSPVPCNNEERGYSNAMYVAAEELERALAAQPAQAGEVALPMETAPRDGTIVRLLVDFDEHATDDGPEPSWTIGAIMAVGEPDAEFQFAGWCWDHDHWTEGKGTPVGWLPFHGDARAAAAASRPATAVPEGFRIEVAYAGDRFVTTQYTLVSPDKRRWTPGPGEVGQQLLVALSAAPQPKVTKEDDDV